MKKFNKIYSCLLILTVFSLFSCLLIQNISRHTFFNQWVLPFGFLLCLSIFPSNRKYISELSVFILNILMFIRYSIAPLLFYTTFNGILKGISYQTQSLILMLYEMVCIFFTIEIFSSKFLGEKVEINKNETYNHSIKLGSTLMIILFIVILMSQPQYLTQLINFNFNTLNEVQVGSSIDGFYNIAYRVGVAVTGCALLSIIQKKRMDGNNEYFPFSLITAIAIIWLTAQGSKGNISRTAFLSNGIAFFLILFSLYPSRKKAILSMGLACISVFLIAGTIIRFNYGDGINITSLQKTINELLNYKMIDAYFAGLEGVSVSLKMSLFYGNRIGLETFISDSLYQIPFVGTRIGINTYNMTPAYYNLLYMGYYGNETMICPLIGQGYVYFGYLAAPLFSVIFTLFALFFNKKLNNSKDILEIYLYVLSTYSMATFIMFNYNILSTFLWNRILPIALIALVNNYYITRRDAIVITR